MLPPMQQAAQADELLLGNLLRRCSIWGDLMQARQPHSARDCTAALACR